MKVTQGTFSFLPELTDVQIRAQIDYCLKNGWAVSVEHTDDPHPRNTYWEMHGQPMFDLEHAHQAMAEIASCRSTFPDHYIRVSAFDATRGWESVRLSFLVNRPASEPGFGLVRQEGASRQIAYTTRPYATDRPSGRP